MRWYRAFAGSALMLACVGQGADAEVVFDKSATFARVRGTIGNDLQDPPEKTAQTTILPTGPLSVADAVSAGSGGSQYAARAFAGVTFVDAAGGTLTLGAAATATTASGIPTTSAAFTAATYFFTVDRASLFTYDFSVERSGDTDLLPTAQVNLSRRSAAGGGNPIGTVLNRTGLVGSGSGTVDLEPGSYLLVWSNYGMPAAVNSALDPGSESLNAALTFGITPAAVPEPASWTMMIGGIGMIGGAMRRRKVGTTVKFA